MEQVGVLRKQIEGAELVQTGGGSPQLQLRMPLGGGSSKKPQIPLRGGRSYVEMRDAQDRARSAASKIAELESGRKTIEEQDKMTPKEFDQHMRRTDLDIGVLKPRVEAAQPQSYEEQYGLEAAQRARPGHESRAYRRGGIGGTTGRSVGAGLAGAYGGLQALLALNRASASGQDAISALGGAGLQGLTSYGTVAPTAQDIGGGVGSRVAVRRGEVRDARDARRDASQFLGQFNPNLMREPVAVARRPAEPTVPTYPGQIPFAHTPTTGFQAKQFAGELDARAHADERLRLQGLPPLKPMMTPLPNAPAPPVAVVQQPTASASPSPSPMTTDNSSQSQVEDWYDKQQNDEQLRQQRKQQEQVNPLRNITEQATSGGSYQGG